MASNANSELRVVTAAKNLCSYVLMVTSKSPKSFRFTLVSRLQNLSLDIVENIYKANEVFVQSKDAQHMQKRLNSQHSALTNVKILAYISLLAREQGCILGSALVDHLNKTRETKSRFQVRKILFSASK